MFQALENPEFRTKLGPKRLRCKFPGTSERLTAGRISTGAFAEMATNAYLCHIQQADFTRLECAIAVAYGLAAQMVNGERDLKWKATCIRM